MIPNDDFGGFEPLRVQKPGFYQPKVDGAQNSRYMCISTPYMARGPGQLTVPGGAKVFLFQEEDQQGMASVIYDGQRGLVPASLLKPADIQMTKDRRDHTLPTGIPLPPGLQPPTRPHTRPSSAVPTWGQLISNTPQASHITAAQVQRPASAPPKHTGNEASKQAAPLPEKLQNVNVVQETEAEPVVLKVHYIYTMALEVPSNTSYLELKEEIAHKLEQPASSLRLRYRKHGSRLLVPLDWELETGRSLQGVSEAGRVSLWCQAENPLLNYTILYQMVALYDYSAQGPEDLEFSEGDTIDILGAVNEEWLEGHCAGKIGIFPSNFAMRENDTFTQRSEF